MIDTQNLHAGPALVGGSSPALTASEMVARHKPLAVAAYRVSIKVAQTAIAEARAWIIMIEVGVVRCARPYG
jgi:hypothetical protein